MLIISYSPEHEGDDESDDESVEEELDTDRIEQPLADFEAFARRCDLKASNGPTSADLKVRNGPTSPPCD